MNQLERYLTELRLPRMLELYRNEADRAAAAQLDYTTYLQRLVEAEYLSKIDRCVSQRINRSGFPCVKTIEEYDFSFQPQLNEKKIRRLCTQEYLDTAVNVVFVGPSGVGKTHLSVGLGVKACQQRRRVQFSSAADLVENLSKLKLMGTLGKELQRLGRLDLLIIDELGYMPLGKESALLLYQVITRRYERGSVILTTNRPFESWGEIFSDTVVASAILDRLLHHSEVFYITGRSYRMKGYESLQGSVSGGADGSS